jgi:hypothetical protein
MSDDDECETETLESNIAVTSSDKQSWSQPLIFLLVMVKKTGKNESNEADTSDGVDYGKTCGTAI